MASPERFVWVGRLTGPKREIGRTIAYDVFGRHPDVECEIVGPGDVPADWPPPPPNVRFVGAVEDVGPHYERADVVFGSGRVAMEAMRLGRPVVAVGESTYVGPVDAATIDRARETNFGDCFFPREHDWDRCRTDVERVLRSEVAFPTGDYPAMLEDYRLDLVASQVEVTYRQAIATARNRHLRELPVLCYHRVLAERPTDSRFNIFVTRATLRRQLESLARRGRRTTTFRELASGRRISKPAVLTFDDGYLDNFENLLPLLEELDARAVIYAVADPELRRNEWDVAEGEPPAPLMTPEQLRACHDTGRVEIASHGLRHAHLPRLSDEEARREILESKARLEDLLGAEVVSFCYPYGEYGEREVELVRKAGYVFAVGTRSGPVRWSDDLHRIRRVMVMPRDRGWSFTRKSSGWYLRYCRLKGKDF